VVLNKIIVAFNGYTTILGIHPSEPRDMFTEIKFSFQNIKEESHRFAEIGMNNTVYLN
jgi:hypothetical protein